MSDIWVSLGPAGGDLRRYIESESPEPLASDACVAVMIGSRLIGWGDDYGTFHPIHGPTSGADLEEAGEALLAAAVSLWEVEDR